MLNGSPPTTKTPNHYTLVYLHSLGSYQLGIPQLNCTHEEADDWMMFPVQDIVSHRCRTLHLLHSHQVIQMSLCACCTASQSIGETLLWLVHNSGVILPLHDISTALGDELTQCLPALHALTGCDTTNKIGLQLNTICKPGNSSMVLNFSFPQLTESSIEIFGEMS